MSLLSNRFIMILILWWRTYSNSGSCSFDYWKEYICLMIIVSFLGKRKSFLQKLLCDWYLSPSTFKLLLYCLHFCFEKGATTVHFRCSWKLWRTKGLWQLLRKCNSFKIDKVFSNNYFWKLIYAKPVLNWVENNSPITNHTFSK